MKVQAPVFPQKLAVAKGGMIATQHWLATEAGVEMLEAGGNAFDAAVAAAFALGVCEPAASGLGGQTMVLAYLGDERRTIALDGSSRAPNRVVPGELPRDEQLRGHRATTVPSTPAVLDYVRARHGRLPLARILEPSVRLARDGVPVTELLRRLTRRERKGLRNGSAASVFLRGDKALPTGSLLQQPALATTLQRLAKKGVEDFYTGRIARAMHADMRKHDGLLHRDDLAQIPWPIERRPISCRFRGLRVHTFPPPGAGQTLAQILRLLDAVPERLRDLDSNKGAVALAEIIRRGLLDRRDRPFDPSFFPQIDERQRLSDAYTQLVSKQITKRVKSGGETTHLSVMDGDGNAVALTQSIERVYGSFEVCPDLGFLYNNYMSAFEYEDITHPYYLRPNAVPWASVAPTIAFRGRRPLLAIGSPGSERIASSVAQVMARLGTQSPLDAVSAPRLHCSLQGKVSFEASRMRSDLPRRLERLGFELDPREPFAFYLGCVQLVMRSRSGFVGVADPRRDGSAAGHDG